MVKQGASKKCCSRDVLGEVFKVCVYQEGRIRQTCVTTQALHEGGVDGVVEGLALKEGGAFPVQGA